MENGFTKSHELVVIGGGLVQDIGAFTSKIFKRGVRWHYHPTTLLSMADSCIGGKCALNFAGQKNQLALFSAPASVNLDFDFLGGLDEKQIASGMGEIVKLFLIGGQNYVDALEIMPMEDKIRHSLLIKKVIIELDEFEANERRSLNLGHSFGHAIEALSSFKVTHGEAILRGIEMVNRLYVKNGRVTETVKRFCDLSQLDRWNARQYIKALRSDKKAFEDGITFVVMDEPGRLRFVKQPLDDAFERRLDEALAY